MRQPRGRIEPAQHAPKAGAARRGASALGWHESRALPPAPQKAPARDPRSAAASASAALFGAGGKARRCAEFRALAPRAASRVAESNGPAPRRAGDVAAEIGAERLQLRPRRDQLRAEHHLRHAAERGGRGKERLVLLRLPDDVENRARRKPDRRGGRAACQSSARRWTSTFADRTGSSVLPPSAAQRAVKSQGRRRGSRIRAG